jgi:iron only hydrogenase large subunit-like protein
VDTVLTTNDLIALFSERHIDPRQVKPVPVDAFLAR